MAWLSKTLPALPAKQQALDVPDAAAPGRIYIDPFAGVGRPNYDGAIYPDSSFETYARQGYARNEVVFACILEKATSLPQSTLRVYPDARGEGEPLEGHRLRRLLAEPNEVTDEFEFFELLVVYRDLGGAAFVLIERARDGLPGALWPLRPDRVRVFPSAVDPRLWTWGYQPDPGRPDVVIPVGRRDMIRVRYPNPLDPYFGQPPLRPAARATSLDNAATEFVDTMLRNSAMPGVIITTADAIDETITDKLTRKWKLKFGGAKRGEPAFLQKGMDVKPIGMTLEQLEFPDLRAISETRICMALNVPPILVGAKVGLDRSTFANYGEARVSLWEETIMPDQQRYQKAFARRLLGEFTGVGRQRIWLGWDNSGVLALRESEASKWERATNALRAGGITVNDYRRIVGLPPVDGGDVFLTPAGVIPQRIREPAAAEPAGEGAAALEAASYAQHYLDQLVDSQRRARRNGHGHLTAGSVT